MLNSKLLRGNTMCQQTRSPRYLKYALLPGLFLGILLMIPQTVKAGSNSPACKFKVGDTVYIRYETALGANLQVRIVRVKSSDEYRFSDIYCHYTIMYWNDHTGLQQLSDLPEPVLQNHR